MATSTKRSRMEDSAKKEEGVVLKIGKSFHENSTTFKLLEASEDIRENLRRGDRVYFKGDDANEAVLCSKTLTYRLKKVETSNTVLLIPPKSKEQEETETGKMNRFEAVGSSTFTYITEIVSPQLESLYQMIAQYPYGYYVSDSTNRSILNMYQHIHNDESLNNNNHNNNDETSHATMGRRPSLLDLIKCVQASEIEILNSLKKCHAIEIDGRWCSIAESLVDETMTNLLETITMNDMSIHSINPKLLYDEMSTYDSTVILHCLKIYSDKETNNNDESDDDSLFKLDIKKVALFCVHGLFKESRTREMSQFELFQSWEKSLPYVEGFIFDKDFFIPLLKGVAIVIKNKEIEKSSSSISQSKKLQNNNTENSSPMYRYFPSNDLPTEPSLRFANIFEVKSEWTKEDLSPYIDPITTTGITIDNLLLKYTRKITPASGDPTPLFCPR